MFSKFSVRSPSDNSTSAKPLHIPSSSSSSSAAAATATAAAAAAASRPQPRPTQPRPVPTAAVPSSPVPKIRPGQTQACEECRRRKSRCDQGRPSCGRCRATGKADRCYYVPQKPRIVPSQRAINDLASTLQQARSIIDKLFPAEAMTQFLSTSDLPGEPPATAPSDDDQKPAVTGLEDRASLVFLGTLSRDKLLELANAVDPGTSHDGRSLAALRKAPALPSDHNRALATLRAHEDGVEFDEGDPDYETDDINALSLTANKSTSYVGSSSVSAALRVIAALCPNVVQRDRLRADSSNSIASSKSADNSSVADVFIPTHKEQAFINAYFEHVHPVVPMLNEGRFRHDYNTGLKSNSSWLGLLNMVLCMGSIAGQTAQHTDHMVYYQRARRYLTYDSFGSGRIETVQALALLGGWYLHYCNQPNMAITIMGTAIRMAYALGLHCPAPPDSESARKRIDPDYETKVKTWWCVVCLDIWGCTTTGRPSMPDYFGPAVSTPRPQYPVPSTLLNKDWSAPLSKAEFDQVELIQLTAELNFCEISAKIQDRLAIAPSLSTTEMEAFDSELELAFMQMPPILRAPNPCPSLMEAPRAILKWRYQNARYLLRRPVLLAAAIEKRATLSESDRRSIRTCRDLAAQTIMDISREWKSNHFLGWHAAWNLFQATFVPLVSLYYQYDSAECDEWRQQVQLACDLYYSLEKWSRAAPRTRQVLSELLDSSHWTSNIAAARSNNYMMDNWDAFRSQHTWAENLLGNMGESSQLLSFGTSQRRLGEGR